MPLSPDLTGVVWGQVDDDPDVFRGPVGLATDAGVAGPFVLIDDDYLDYGKGSGEVVLFGGIEDEEEDDDVTTVDEVVVTGELRDRTSPSIVGGGGGLVIGGSGDGNDVDPVPPPPPPVDQYDACQDRKADTLADDINDEIALQPDSNQREYGALIWQDSDGNLHRTRLLVGNNFRLTELDTVTPQSLGFSNWSQVVGIVHSHPTMIDTGTEANPTGLYTPVHSNARFDLMSGGDHSYADSRIALGASRSNLTSYISHGGSVREFDYSDNLSESRDDLIPGVRGTESGDYAPGAQCP